MTDALSGRQCITISAVKPLLSHLISEVLVEKEYTDADFEHLSDLASLLDLRFKFEYVKDKARGLEEVESSMSIRLIFCQVGKYLAFLSSLVDWSNDQTTTTSSNNVRGAASIEPQLLLTKKVKDLS